MPDRDLNDIYSRLGSVEATNNEILRQLTALFKKLDVQQSSIHELSGVAKEASRIAALNEKKMKDDIEPIIDDYKKLKNRGLGAIGLVGIMASAAGAWSSRYLSGS